VIADTIAEAGSEFPTETTVDAFIGGRVEAVQPMGGHHRSGLEAVLLGASVDSDFAGTLIDLGSGVGVAGMVAAARCSNARTLLVDRDETAVACARAALTRPANQAFAPRVSVVAADVEAPEGERERAGLRRASADVVLTNPPFHVPATTTPPPGAARSAAHVLGGGGLDAWMRAAASALKPAGRLVVIFRADGLAGLMQAIGARFGGADILPIQPRDGEVAHRVLVRAVSGSRAGSRLLPPLVLHGETGGAYLPAVERILRDGAGLSEIHSAWRSA
jgi:tRNA1(Val) A37 N6-methylase TrmN6